LAFLIRFPLFFFLVTTVVLVIVLGDNLESGELDSRYVLILLAVQYLFELAGEVIELEVLVISLISLHKAVALVLHVFPDRLA
jgi:hypothetical protein